jgi:spore photoproduct lyase
MFHPDEIVFISFGSVTFIKPVIKKIRNLGFPTKILQMKFVTDPHGKLTYSDEIKIEKFSFMYNAFKEWRDKVFIYLCMEKSEIWEKKL